MSAPTESTTRAKKFKVDLQKGWCSFSSGVKPGRTCVKLGKGKGLPWMEAGRVAGLQEGGGQTVGCKGGDWDQAQHRHVGEAGGTDQR